METLSTAKLKELIGQTSSPCVSIYQPTHRANPDNLQDSIRYKNLLRDAENSLLEKHSETTIRPLMDKLQTLAGDYQFWIHQRDGLGVLVSADTFQKFQLQRRVKEFVVVADSFHLKPLVRMVQSADRYQVLCLDRHKISLFEGNRDALDPVNLGDMPATIEAALGDELTDPHLTVGSYGAGAARAAGGGAAPAVHGHGGKKEEVDIDRDRFFRFIDREVLARFSRPSGLPLVLVAPTEHHAEFHRISHNPFLQAAGVAKHPNSFSGDQLRTEVWKVVEPTYHARLAKLVEDHTTAAARQQGSGDLSDIARAAVEGRVGTLLIEADREVAGRLDRTTGAISFDRITDPEIDDLIDDVSEMVILTGGEVVVVPKDRMPTKSGLAATFRY